MNPGREAALEALRLVTVEEQPFNAETPMQALTEPLTPTALFYVRNHFPVPRIQAGSWRLVVDGEVERRLELSLNELRNLPERTLVVTLECAGNGRRRMSPVPPGTPWMDGAVGTARFTGTPLHHVLDKARARSPSAEVVFTGADRGEVKPGRVESFVRSLPLELARHADTLLAWAMNDELLVADHGAPLRLVMPRWYGVASVKWLTRISVASAPFEGYFQSERYVYVGEAGIPEETPVLFMRVRAVFGRPAEGEELSPGPVELAGTAWSGGGAVRRVEVSADGGASWMPAELGQPLSPYAATPWRSVWVPPGAGRYTLVVRATDAVGNTQPLEPLSNAYGYGNNAVHRVRVTVR